MIRKPRHLTITIRFVLSLAIVLVLAAPLCAEPWRFGVMGDTQWAVADDGKNPDTVAVGIIDQVQREFIRAGVRFVIQVGDLADTFSGAAMDTRASAASGLYEKGIGFFPLRGNHDDPRFPANPVAAAQYFQKVFPQTRGTGPYLFGASSFSSPREGLRGLSYSFHYENSSFVLLDQFTAADGKPNSIPSQQNWISDSLFKKPAGGHAFVFAHKNLIGQSHADTLFGKTPADDLSGQNDFIGSLQFHGVRYFISGHDHLHHRSTIKSPDGLSKTEQLICASGSTKFYIPANPSNDKKYNNPPREVSLSRELNTIGYYIFTVDGPRVTVDYYSAAVDPAYEVKGKPFHSIKATPALAFWKRETFGYSLDGKAENNITTRSWHRFFCPTAMPHRAQRKMKEGVLKLVGGVGFRFASRGAQIHSDTPLHPTYRLFSRSHDALSS